MKKYEPWIQKRALELANEGNPNFYKSTDIHFLGSLQALMKLIEEHETKPVCEDLLLARKIAYDLFFTDSNFLDGNHDETLSVQRILKTLKENKYA